MAGALILGVVLRDAVSKLSSAILEVTNKTRYFKSKPLEIETTIELMKPIFDDMEKLNKELDRNKNESDMFIKLVKQTENLVQICQHIKLNLWKRYRHASKLEDFSKSLQKFVNLQLPVQTARDVKETLSVVIGLKKGSSSRWSCGVQLQKGVVIGFDDRVKDLKEMVLKDSHSPHDDCSIVVVSGAGGSGKTTLITMLCGDPDIIAKFQENIYYVIVSQSYDLKVIVTKLFGSLPNNTNNDEEAIQQWGSFLGKNEFEILLVLDDVWSESVITEFKFKSPKYKILVTSRITFTQFRTYHLQGLNNHDATHLFRCSAFSEQSNIPEELVEKLVKCCKNHPLALSVVGGSLKGAHVANWQLRLKQLFEEKMSFLDLHVSVQRCLEKSSYFLDVVFGFARVCTTLSRKEFIFF